MRPRWREQVLGGCVDMGANLSCESGHPTQRLARAGRAAVPLLLWLAPHAQTQDVAAPESCAIQDHIDCPELFGLSPCNAPLSENTVVATNSPYYFRDPVPPDGESTLLGDMCPESCGVCEPTPAFRDFRNSCDRAGSGCKSLGACSAAGPWTENREVFDMVCLANSFQAEIIGTGMYYGPQWQPPPRPGVFHCSCCGAPLYRGSESFNSGSGWPAFSNPVDGQPYTAADGTHHIQSDAVHINPEDGELVCGVCGLHLGHRFSDGPPPEDGGTHLRDCINSACMRWVTSSDPPLVMTHNADPSNNSLVPLCCDEDEDEGLCRSDLTDDGVIDVNDLLALLSAFGNSGAGLRAADIDEDEDVDVDDLLSLLSDYGGTC